MEASGIETHPFPTFSNTMSKATAEPTDIVCAVSNAA